MMLLLELIENVPGIKIVDGSTEVEINAVTLDSREVGQGSLFCAIQGLQTDGHQYIPQAVAAGASAILCDRAEDLENPGVTRILCENTREVLPLVAARFHGKPAERLDMIGITGTNGKTTTAYFVQHLLNQSGKPTGRIGTTGISYGEIEHSSLHTTPESSDLQAMLSGMLAAEMEAVVMEVSSHALHQHRVKGIPYRVALFTNLSQDHLDYHSDLEDYLAAKRILFEDLNPGSIAIVNADDPRSEAILAGCKARIVSLAVNASADYRILAWEQQAELVHLQVQTPIGEMSFKARTVGMFNYYNVLSAIAICVEMGINSRLIQNALETLPIVPGRLEDASGSAPFRIVVDYAHTPEAIERVLGVLRTSYPEARLLTVFGCGGDRDRNKRPQMGQIATSLSDKSFITDDNPRTEPSDQIIQDIIKGVAEDADYKVINDRREAVETALNTAKTGDVVAILGKGHEDYQEIMGKRIPFSDIEIIKTYRADHGY